MPTTRTNKIIGNLAVVEATTMESGDVLLTFSDDIVVLYQAQFLYDVRTQDGNLPIVDPFSK